MTYTNDWTPLDAQTLGEMHGALIAHLLGRVQLAEPVVDACVLAALADVGLSSGLEPKEAIEWAEQKATAGVTVTIEEDEDGNLTIDFEFEADEAEEEA